MAHAAIVEIPSSPSGVLGSAMIRAAYEASRRGPVMLLLMTSDRKVIDRALDPLVSANRHVHGVSYRDPDDADVWRAVSETTVVIATTPRTMERARHLGVECLDANDGLEALVALGAQAA